MKTSQMIAMLEQNPGLKFKAYTCLNHEAGIEMQTREGYDGKVLCFDDCELTINEITLKYDWTLIPQPVPWQEALQARLDGKTVKVDCPDCGGDADSCVFEPTQDKESVCFSALKEGTFYIIEAPID